MRAVLNHAWSSAITTEQSSSSMSLYARQRGTVASGIGCLWPDSYSWMFRLIIVSSFAQKYMPCPYCFYYKASISPDGRTLLSVGDSPDVYLHRITGGAHVRFTQMTKLSLAPYITTCPTYSYSVYSPYHSSTPVPASFSAAFSANGSKFAVASQEGVVVVWDVRSTKPLKVIETDKSRPSTISGRGYPTGAASGWLFESPWDWGRGAGKAPGWGVRSVKFSPRGVGREVLTFTEVSRNFLFF